MGKEKRERFLVILLTALFVIVYFGIVTVNRFYQDGTFSIFGMEIGSSNIMGCLNGILMIISIAMVCVNWSYGGIIANILVLIALAGNSMALFRGGVLSPLPGIVLLLSDLFFIYVLRKRFKIIETNNKLYQQISITDSLTGAKNRRGIREEASKLIESETPFYLVFFDLDNFKYVNDTLGHRVGDSILITIADRCRSLYGDCILGRNGGDEFIMLIKDTQGLDIDDLAARYLEKINEEIVLKELNIRYIISASLGIAHFPNDAKDLDSIVNYADAAMYEAKKGGKNRVKIFSREMAEMAIKDKAMENLIIEGMRKNCFYMMYQPQFDITTKKLRGFEALVRYKDEEGNVVSPSEFIPVAEKSDLILELDTHILRIVTTEFKDLVYKCLNTDELTISVNVSAKHITEKSFVEDLGDILEEIRYPAQCLEIELTEYGMIRDMESATYTLENLNEVGIKIALDDFGTGYASLAHLTRLPINLLKIDRSFINNLCKNELDNKFVGAIISMGHMLNCHIVSEGVETTEQLEILREKGCDYVQGYIWGKPMTFSEAKKLVEQEMQIKW